MNVQQALHQFWSQFTLNGNAVKAYPQGQTPSDAAFPNISYTLPVGGAFSQLYATATLWIREENGQNHNALRHKFFDDVAKAIPEEGAIVTHDNGYVMLIRGDEFETLHNTGDVVDGRTVYGGIVRYQLRYYGVRP